MNDLTQFLIRGKGDYENARKLVALGYPAVAPVLSHMMEWVQDMNWPVAHIIAPFLASIGEPILPEVEKVFDTDDLTWQYWCITDIIGELPADVANRFRPTLERLAFHPTPAEHHQELDEVAREVLDKLDSGVVDNA